MIQGRTAGVPANLIILLGYFLAGFIGISLNTPLLYAAIFWPASGVAFVAMLFYGRSALPGIFIGSLSINIYIGGGFANAGLENLLVPVGVGLGATAQTYLAYRFAHSIQESTSSEKARIYRLMLFAGPVACLLNASNGTLLLWSQGVISDDLVGLNWLQWWFGDSIGVVLVVCWAIALSPSLLDIRTERRLPLVGGLLSISAMALLLNMLVISQQAKLAEDTIKYQANELRAHVKDALDLTVETLFGLRGMVSGHEAMTPEIFRTYASEILSINPILDGLSWNQAVTGEQLESFDQKMREQFNAPNFKTHQRDDRGNLIAAIPQVQHIVVTYIEPLEPNHKALGYDVYSQKNRREALDAAIASRNAVATAPITLVQTGNSQSGTLVFLPVFSSNNQLLGVATAVIEIGSLMEAVLERVPNDVPIIRLTSGDSTLLYGFDRSSEAGLEVAVEHEKSVAINFAGQSWTLSIIPRKPYLPVLVLIIILGSLLIAAGLSTVFVVEAFASDHVRREVDRQTAKLAEVNESQKRMFAIIGHELRTPLAAINMMLEDEDVFKQPKTRAQMLEMTKLALSELNDLREAVRPNALKPKLEYTSGSVADTVTTIAERRKEVMDQPAEFHLSIDDGANLPLSIPSRGINQVVLNLVRNASIHGAASNIWLTVNAERQATEANSGQTLFTVTIEDDGAGIPAEKADRLFEQFYQTSDANQGMGLGLAVCRSIAQQAGGDVRYEPRETGGSRFIFTFMAYQTAGTAPQATERAEPLRLTGLKVLLVEDTPTLRALTKRVLEKAGAQVVTAENGRRAIEQETWNYDLVLTDIFMPEMDGYGLVEYLRGRGITIPVIGLSAATIGDEMTRLIELGANAVIPKPFDLAKFLDAVSQLGVTSQQSNEAAPV